MKLPGPIRSHKKRLKVKPAPTEKRTYGWKKWVFGLPISLVVPFFVLVRLSTWLYLAKGVTGWIAVLLSVVSSGVLIGAVIAVVVHRLGIKPGRWIMHTVTVMMSVYAVYLLVFVSAANVKSVALKETYTQLHPILRVAVSSFIVLDGKAVLTDTGRQPDDYEKMGLGAAKTSLHFEQADGYAHAVDLRTNGRSKGRNFMTKMYFVGMGFSNLRHTGTADHLHISLPVR